MIFPVCACPADLHAWLVPILRSRHCGPAVDLEADLTRLPELKTFKRTEVGKSSGFLFAGCQEGKPGYHYYILLLLHIITYYYDIWLQEQQTFSRWRVAWFQFQERFEKHHPLKVSESVFLDRSAPGIPKVEEQRPKTSPAPHREICAICLETLDDCSFSYPCGQGHRLHYGCTIHFLASVLALPLSDDSPGPLLKEQVRDMGNGWKAIGVLEVGLEIMTHETRSRLGCPLCRCPWPETASLSEIMAQLRLCRTRQVAKLANSLETAFQQAPQKDFLEDIYKTLYSII